MNNYKNHQELVNRFKLQCREDIPNLRLFDRTVGLFYTRRINNGVVDYNRIKINNPGMADLYGLYKTNKGIIHLEFEIKSSSKAMQTKEQKNWENFINNKMNGFYLVVRDEKEGVDDTLKYLDKIGVLKDAKNFV